MKKKEPSKLTSTIVTIVILLALTVMEYVALVYSIEKGKRERIEGITSFSFSHGDFWNGELDYGLVKQDNLVLLTEKCMGCQDSFEIEKTVDKKYLGEIAKIINKYEVAKWDGFDESDDVTDGEGFSLKVTFGDGKAIEAHGYMKFPLNYHQVRDEFDDLFEKLR